MRDEWYERELSPSYVKLEVSLPEIPEVTCSPQKFHQFYNGPHAFPINSHFFT